MVSWIAYYLIKIVSFILGHLSLKAALTCGRIAGNVCWLFHRRKWIAYANLRAAFRGKFRAKELQRIARKMYGNLGETFVELLRFPYITKEYIENNFLLLAGSKERIDSVLQQGNGGVFLTAHLDNWELAGYYSAAQGYPLKVLVTEQKISKVNDLLNNYRELCGNTVIGKGMPLREMMSALQNNELVAIVGDQGGDREDVYLRFFGRLVATPPGAFRIAQKYKSAIIPCMMMREPQGHHAVHILEPFIFGDDNEVELRKLMERYFTLLERYIQERPDQWLWGHKRWKHCRTKRVAIISDEKPGHVNQSKAIFSALKDAVVNDRTTDGTAYEFELTHVSIEFKSAVTRKVFLLIAPLMITLLKGRLSFLRFFLTPSSYQTFADGYYDITISCGASVIPFSLLLKNENLAKNVVIMKPPFPYDLFQHDLVVKHAHDKAIKTACVVETLLAPTVINEAFVRSEGEALARIFRLKSDNKYFGVLIGGDAKSYRFDVELFRGIIVSIRECAEALNFKILVTNSRRTRGEITRVLQEELSGREICPLFIDVNEHNPPKVVYGMIGLADVVFVSEESVSMISESVQSGKKVCLVKPSLGRVAPKHQKFHALLQERGLLKIMDGLVSVEGVREHCMARSNDDFLQQNMRMLQDKLKTLL
jgi:Kdo2-lipid IVA lauroyltransferase/acyltransferase